jgi:phosphoribosyl 1,2-cyclic phosphodiesterase
MSVQVRFWGTRGSIPTPGKDTLKYGGNTSCVEIRSGDQIFVCDSGTGIRGLGTSLMKEFKGQAIDVNLFVSHTHWDHIQGFPFFIPSYVPKNRLSVVSGKSVGDSFENIIRGQMAQNYFPVEIGDMQASIEFKHSAEEMQVGPVTVRTTYTNHPGVDVAYRFDMPGGISVIYLTDHENHQALGGVSDLTKRQDDAIIAFCKGADLLICDAQYTDDEYEAKKGWGHSRWKDTVHLGLEAGVKKLALFHHDPERSDGAIDTIVDASVGIISKSGKSMECFGAQEGQTVSFG